MSQIKSDFYPDIEISANDFYVAGADLGQWKNGSVNGQSTRYAVGSFPGETFNYGIFGDYLVISTNFDGFKAAVFALGF